MFKRDNYAIGNINYYDVLVLERKNMIKAIFMDIDDTILDFSAFVKKAMKEGFEKYGLLPYSDKMFLLYNKINGKLWQSVELKELTVQELNSMCWNMFFKEIGISFDSRLFEDYFCKEILNIGL